MAARWSAAALGVGCVLVVVGAPALYAAAVLGDEDRFVAVAQDVFAEPQVRKAIADRSAATAITAFELDSTVAAVLPEGVRAFSVPIAQLTAQQVAEASLRALDGPAMRSPFEAALREVHSQLTAESGDVVVDLRAVLVRAAREVGGPAVGFGAADVLADGEGGRYTLADASEQGDGAVLDAIRSTRSVGLWLLVGAALAFALSIVIAADRRARLIDVGVGIVGAAVVSVLTVDVVTGLIADNDVERAVSGVIVAHLVSTLTGLIAVGAALVLGGVLAGSRATTAARILLAARRGEPDAIVMVARAIEARAAGLRAGIWTALVLLLRGWDQPTNRVVMTIIVIAAVAQLMTWFVVSTSPAAGRARAACRFPAPAGSDGIPHARRRAELLVIAGLVLVLWPGWDRALVIDIVVAGAIAQLSVEAVLAVRRSGARREERVAATEPHGRSVSIGVGLVVAATIIGIGVAASASSTAGSPAPTGCNGSLELCDRTIDEVVFAGSHNSMSSTALGWDLAMQTGDIVAQLDHGIRALLIDTHYWDDSGAVEGGDDPLARAAIEAALADDVPQPGTWLCHGFCALGATKLTAALADIRFWLDANPNEVVLMVVQDAITTDDTFAAFEDSGLIELVHQHEPGTPFPTLGELVERNERLLVYAENAGTPDSWYQNGYASTFAETPYTFDIADDFSCEPNRGDEANPLFLINHWVTTGVPVLNAAVRNNSAESLAERVEQCAVERDRFPTVIAVDFAETGDLVKYVAELNGVEPPD